MLDHMALQVSDVQASRNFYVTVLRPRGIREAMRYERPDGIVVGLAGPDGSRSSGWDPPSARIAARSTLPSPHPTGPPSTPYTKLPARPEHRCCTSHESGRSTTRATTAYSSATSTETTSRPCTTPLPPIDAGSSSHREAYSAFSKSLYIFIASGVTKGRNWV